MARRILAAGTLLISFLLLVLIFKPEIFPFLPHRSDYGNKHRLTAQKFRALFQSGQPVAIAIVGDSTTGGFGANSGLNKWPRNGLAYGCMNNPTFSPNWDKKSVYYINMGGFPSQSQQDNVGIPSGTRLLRTYVESLNPDSKVYNYGGSGYVAATHVADGTINAIAALTPKPQVVFLALGINSAKNGVNQDSDLRALVSQAIAHDILPVLVKENNIAVAGSPSGNWSETATPDQWYPMARWQSVRANIDQIAFDNNLEVIDLGNSSGTIDVALLYDPFHPNRLGYQAIYNTYRAWLLNGATEMTKFYIDFRRAVVSVMKNLRSVLIIAPRDHWKLLKKEYKNTHKKSSHFAPLN